MKVNELPLPCCMMPDGADPCATYQQLQAKAVALERVVQMCFEDACKPSGKLSKVTVVEIMKHADTRA